MKNGLHSPVVGLDYDGQYFQENKFAFYIGTVYFGVNYDYLPVLWDTGTEWSIVMSHLCSSCSGHATYDYSEEVGTSFFYTPDSNGERNFGSVRTEGFEAKDYVCLVTGKRVSCTFNQDIFIITKQEGLPNSISGIIGLAPVTETGTNLIN